MTKLHLKWWLQIIFLGINLLQPAVPLFTAAKTKKKPSKATAPVAAATSATQSSKNNPVQDSAGLDWDTCSNLVYAAFMNSELGGVQKLYTDFDNAKKKLTLNALVGLGWHFTEKSLGADEKLKLSVLNSQNFTTLLKILVEDLAYLPADKSANLSAALVTLQQSLAFLQDDAQDANKNNYPILKTYRDLQLPLQKSFFFMLENSRNLLTMLADKVELISYFEAAEKASNDSNDKSKNAANLVFSDFGKNITDPQEIYKTFVMHQKLFEALWRLQTLGTLLLQQALQEDIFLQSLSDSNLDELLRQINLGILAFVPEEKNLQLPSTPISIATRHQQAIVFATKAVCAGIKLADGKDPRFAQAVKPMYAQNFLAALAKRIAVADKNNLKNFAKFDTAAQYLQSLLEKYGLKAALPTLNITAIARPKLSEVAEPAVTEEETAQSSGDESAADDAAPAEPDAENTDISLEALLSEQNIDATSAPANDAVAKPASAPAVTAPTAAVTKPAAASPALAPSSVKMISEIGAFYGNG